jgi:hypothetical protein
MNTDTKKWARVYSLREWGSVKQKLCKQACKIFAFFCQSQIDGIIRAHLRNPWLVLLQPRPARGLLKSGKFFPPPADVRPVLLGSGRNDH